MVLRRNRTTFTKGRLMAGDADSSNLSSLIQEKAYSLYEKRGYSNGNDWSDWFEAERQVKKELGIR